MGVFANGATSLGCYSGVPFVPTTLFIERCAIELMHYDVCVPMKTTSIGGSRYFVIFVDDFSCKIWMYVFKSKIEVLTRFR